METLFGMKLDVKLVVSHRQAENDYYNARGIDEDVMSDAYRVEVLGKKLLVASTCDFDINGLKILHTYNSHESALRSSGIRRTFTPQEILGLLMMNEEDSNGSLQLENLIDDMSSDEGEFTCSAASYDGIMLHIYEYVKGIVWHEENEKYIIPKGNRWYDKMVSFGIGEVDSFIDLYDIQKKSPRLLKYLFGRGIDDIPKSLREGEKSICMHLVNDGAVRPIAIGDFGTIDVLSTDEESASRGVYELK